MKLKNIASNAIIIGGGRLQEPVIRLILLFAPSNRYANVALGMIYRSRAEHRLAARAYIRAGTKSREPSTYLRLAISLYLADGQIRGASEQLVALARLRRSETWLKNLSGAVEAFCAEGNAAQARRIAARLGGAIRLRDVAGLIYLFSGDAENARSYLEGTDWQAKKWARTVPVSALSAKGWVWAGSSDAARQSTATLLSLRAFSQGSLRRLDLDQPVSAVDVIERRPFTEELQQRMRGTVYCMAEPRAGLSRLSELPEYAETEFTFFANGDRQAEQAAALGLQTRSLRELVTDQSPVTDGMYAHAERFARFVVRELLDATRGCGLHEFLQAHRETMELLLEDRIAREFMDLEWFAEAAGSCPAEADFLLICSDGSRFLRFLSWITPRVDEERLRFLTTTHSDWSRADFAHAVSSHLFEPQNRRKELLPVEYERSTLNQTLQKLESWRTTLARELTEDAAADLAPFASPPAVVVANLEDRNYGDGNYELVSTLSDRRDLLVLSTSDRSSAAWKAPSARKDIPVKRIKQICEDRPGMNDAFDQSELLAAHLLHNGDIQALTYQGQQVWPILIGPVSRWCRADLPLALVEAAYLEQLLMKDRSASLIVSPGRGRTQRLAATIASREGLFSLDVQMLNTPGYRKYKPPITDRLTAIDDVSRDLFVDYFGVEPERIVLAGSPKLDMFRAAVTQYTRDQVLAELNLDTVGGPVVCFASQLQPIEFCLEVVKVLTAFVRQHPGSKLLVKMHPREDSAREVAYEDLIRAGNLQDRVSLLRNYEMHKVYAATDVLVTMYSNAAREALVLGKRVLIANFTGQPWPIRFDLPGLADGAYSPEQLLSLLEANGAQTDREVGSSYGARNSHLTSSAATEIIAEVIESSGAL